MKPTIQYKIKKHLVQVIHDDGEVVVKNGVLIEGEQLCAIYDLDEESFPFVCTLVDDLDHMLSTQGLSMQVGNWEEGMEIEQHEGEMMKKCSMSAMNVMKCMKMKRTYVKFVIVKACGLSQNRN